MAGSIFGVLGFVWVLRAHKMTIKPGKMAILGPNLKNDLKMVFFPRDIGEVLL